MTFSAIKDAIGSSKPLFVDSKEVEVLFFDHITGIIEIKYLESGVITFVTKSSLSETRRNIISLELDELLILRPREVGHV